MTTLAAAAGAPLATVNRRRVAAGTFVTTGTHTGMVFTQPGVQIRAEYGPLGHVEVSFPG